MTAMLMRIPTIARQTSIDDPPKLMKGKVMPLVGSDPVTTPMFNAAWMVMIRVMPNASNLPNRSSTLAAIRIPQTKKTKNSISTDMVPLDFHCPPMATSVATPNIDALCAVKFRHAFATSPLCSPSRAAYMTGRHSYITTNGERAHDGHAIHLRPDDVIFPEYLKATGYHTRHVGKCHVGAAKFIDVFGENDAPWDRWSPPWQPFSTF